MWWRRWQAMSGRERFEKVVAQSQRLRDMARAAIRRRHPEFSDDQVRVKFIELTYGKKLATAVAARIEEKPVEPA